MIRARVSEHQAHFYQLISNPLFCPGENDDGFSLGRHLVESHGMTRSEFKPML